MGEVYAAEPLDGGGRVAIKVLKPEFLVEQQILSRFLEEARTCIRLVHPHIVRIFECGVAEEGSPFIVMELLDGVPLGAYTQNGGRVPTAQAVSILQGILAGLAAAHAQGVVHRDLKPDNVFLTRGADGTFVVKVLDFGIAKVMDEAGGMGTRTRTGMLLGTPGYMSPEQVKDPREVDPRADLWSAGVMFYEMLTGRVAFPAPTAYARMAAVMSVDPEPLERIDPAFAPLSGFVARALKKNRDERYASALEMARTLAGIAPGAAVPADGVARLASAETVTRFALVETVAQFAPAEAAARVAPSATPWTSPGDPPATFRQSGTGLAPAAGATPGNRRSEPAPPIPRAPGGTLASAAIMPFRGEAGSNVLTPSVESRLVGETLPSTDLPIIVRGVEAKRGVPRTVVVMLVVGALVVGFLLGWSFGTAG
jgi:serine/threonine-protein kinase